MLLMELLYTSLNFLFLFLFREIEHKYIRNSFQHNPIIQQNETTRTMQKRHYGQRSEFKTAADGLTSPGARADWMF